MLISIFGFSMKKCIQISTNKPCIGPAVLEITPEFLENIVNFRYFYTEIQTWKTLTLSTWMLSKDRWQAKIFQLFEKIQNLNFYFIMKYTLQWVQTSLVLVQWFFR